MTKKIISLLLVLMMVMSLLPVSAFATEDEATELAEETVTEVAEPDEEPVEEAPEADAEAPRSPKSPRMRPRSPLRRSKLSLRRLLRSLCSPRRLTLRLLPSFNPRAFRLKNS